MTLIAVETLASLTLDLENSEKQIIIEQNPVS
jgi:hypothetical protein